MPVSERRVCLSGGVSEPVELLQHVASAVDEPCSGRRHRDASAAPLEQARTDLALEAPDMLAERLRRDEVPLGGPPEVQLLGQGHDVLKRADVHAALRPWSLPRRLAAQ